VHTNQIQPPTKGKTTAYYEKHVVNVDIAKRLKAGSLTLPSMFFWVCNPELGSAILYQSSTEYHGPLEHKLPAPTAFELKEHFPVEVWVTVQLRSLRRCKGLFYFTKYNGLYAVSLMVKGDGTDQVYEFHREEADSEADACGAMLAYIFENHLNEVHTN
jgi:hypothetical protein